MAMDFEIKIDLGELLQIGPLAEAAVFRNLSAAVQRVAIAGAERWKEAVAHAPLWEGERRAYVDSIRWEMTGTYSAVIISDYKYVADIENARPARDLKRMLDTSMKVRRSKKGRRYLIIPIRHNTPGNDALAPTMPDHVYAQARQLAPSQIVAHGRRQSGTGAYSVKTRSPYLVMSRGYRWGGSLPAGLAPKLKPHHKTDIYAGMYRFDTKIPRSSGRSSSYMTFRVMVEGAAGWIVPAKPGLHLAQTVADSLRPIAEQIFQRAVQIDSAG